MAITLPNLIVRVERSGEVHMRCSTACFYLSDAREPSAYTEDHVILARSATNKKTDELEEFYIPFDAHLPTTIHCVVYDSNTVSIIEKSE
jgi:hypothetical protein